MRALLIAAALVAALAASGAAARTTDETYSANITAAFAIQTTVAGLTPGDTYAITWAFTSAESGQRYVVGGPLLTVSPTGRIRLPSIDTLDLNCPMTAAEFPNCDYGYAPGDEYEVWLRDGADWGYVTAPAALGPDGLPLEYELLVP